jgi:glyoxylase-like metal-dependent hydrolase (beta-lactamase superfamily II)
VTVATDGVARFKMAEDHVINIKKDVVNAALAEVFMEKDMMTTPYNPVAINTGGKLAVIDTGTGAANYNNSKGVGGQFLTNLAAAGIERAAVDTVIISHYHGDHINGLLMADGSVTYPNAEILVPAVEHKYWMDDGEMSRATNGRVQTNFKNIRRVFNAEVMKRAKTYEWGKDVIPGVTAQGTPGHTIGHTSFVISSGSDAVYLQSDVTHVRFCLRAIPTGTRSTTRMAPWRKPPAARSMTCWWPTRCGCRGFIIRSRRSPMSRKSAAAIGRFR